MTDCRGEDPAESRRERKPSTSRTRGTESVGEDAGDDDSRCSTGACASSWVRVAPGGRDDWVPKGSE